MHMRRSIVVFVAASVVALTVGTASAKPHRGDGTLVSAQVAGLSFPAVGEAVPFTGTLTVERFVEVDSQLVVNGTLTPDLELFAPLAVAVVVVAAPSVDQVTGDCTVEIGTTNTLVEQDFLIELIGQAAAFELGGPGSDQDLCRVVRAEVKNPYDEGVIAKALNQALGLK
jgi:hypothetical protein